MVGNRLLALEDISQPIKTKVWVLQGWVIGLWLLLLYLIYKIIIIIVIIYNKV